MDENYIINDQRDSSHFKKITFSGYKKLHVFNALFKSIESGKIEEACHWTTECIISGYSNTLLDRLIIFSSKVVHINNPKIPKYIFKKSKIYDNQVKLLDKKIKDRFLLLRNSQMIRNLFFDITSTLCSSLKTKRYDKYPQIKDSDDFKPENIKKRLCNTMNILPDHIIKFNDMEEIRIIINEIFTMCKNKQFGYSRCCFWILWLLKWESQHKKKNIPWRIDYREINDIDKKYRCDIIWIIWDVIIEETKIRNDEKITCQIKSLYQLYKKDYTNGKKKSRLPLLFNSIGYLTHNINFSIPLRNNFSIFIKVQCNVNKMFASKKGNEIIDKKKSVKRKINKKENINVEIIQDKISIFNDFNKI